MKETFRLFCKKVLENLASVKVWFFLLPFLASTGIFVYICSAQFGFMTTAIKIIAANPELTTAIMGQIKIITDTFLAWCTFNITLTGSIMAVREVYKVRKLKEINEAKDDEKTKSIENVNV